MHPFRILFVALLISTSAHAMDQEGSPVLRGASPETLAFLMDSLDVSHNQAAQELALFMHAMSLRITHPSPKSKFEQIVNLAIQLNLCLIKDEGYYKEIEPACATTKKELAQLTREKLKNIVRLTKSPSPDLCLLKQTIHQIDSFKLKYMLSTQGLPLVVEDTTSRFKREMLMALHC